MVDLGSRQPRIASYGVLDAIVERFIEPGYAGDECVATVWVRRRGEYEQAMPGVTLSLGSALSSEV